ncbi:MAG: YigZ family protein [Candidatus Glassbacteria bacterium]|nr:YigZ family protein [Candidatus Glassbacteria bacterium]
MQIPEEDLVTTVAGPGAAETRVKGSRFLAVAEAAPERGDAGKIVRREEKKYHDAAHHCWAWRALAGPQEQFYDDDGEPAGTAGAPILQAVERAGLCGVVVVVTRYFGGVKLGTGGLARAYGEAAGLALEAAGLRHGMIARELELSFDYPLTGRITRLVESFPAVVVSRRFEARVGLNIAVALSRADSLAGSLTEAAAGKIGIALLGAGPVFP